MKQVDVHKMKPKSRCALIVARPGDETLWAGGFILMHPEVKWFVVSLSGAKDPVLVQRFQEALAVYGARGLLGKLMDDHDGHPLASVTVEKTIMELLPTDHFELLVTHALWGEYTRDLCHEEVGHAVQILYGNQRLHAPKLLCFAYEDQDGQAPPQADTDAEIQWPLPDDIGQQKEHILKNIYGYKKSDWQLRHAPKHEAFWLYRRHSP